MTNDFVFFAHWSVRQKLNRVTSVQFSSVTSLYTHFKANCICGQRPR